MGELISPVTDARAVCGTVSPSVQVTEAIPPALVVAVGWLTEPPCAVAAKFTITPATTTLFWSFTITEIGVPSGWPAGPTWPLPPFLAIWVAPWICAVAPNVTGEPVRPVLEAVALWAPALAPRVHVTTAMPLASLLLVRGSDPPPVVPHTTVTLETGLLCASVTRTRSAFGSDWPAGPTWLSPEFVSVLAMLVAGGGGGVPPPPPPQAARRSVLVRGAARDGRRVGMGASRVRGPERKEHKPQPPRRFLDWTAPATLMYDAPPYTVGPICVASGGLA